MKNTERKAFEKFLNYIIDVPQIFIAIIVNPIKIILMNKNKTDAIKKAYKF